MRPLFDTHLFDFVFRLQSELQLAQAKLERAQQRVTQLEELQTAISSALTLVVEQPQSPRTSAGAAAAGVMQPRDPLNDIRLLQESLIKTKLAYAEAEHQKELYFMEARDERKKAAAFQEVHISCLSLSGSGYLTFGFEFE